MNLDAFANTESVKTGYRAWWASLPEDVVAEVVVGYRGGIPKATIVRWLKSEGYDATINKLNRLIEDNK